MEEILEELVAGRLSIEDASKRLRGAMVSLTDDACVDLDRQERCGFAEVVYAEGKTPDAVTEIFASLKEAGQNCLATRATLEQADAVLTRFPDAVYNSTGRTLRLEVHELPQLKAFVPVVSAGTSDRPVAEETLETLRWMNCPTELIVDVGVAGPHRLVQHVPTLRKGAAVIVIAGMEGALPSVVGGHVGCPVIAVPTSVGYGASFGGVAALLGMLNSCSSNVTVVNIDAGFKAAYVAGLIARQVSEIAVNKGLA